MIEITLSQLSKICAPFFSRKNGFAMRVCLWRTKKVKLDEDKNMNFVELVGRIVILKVEGDFMRLK